MAAKQRKKIYLDQNALSHLAGDPGDELQSTKYGRVINDAKKARTAEVWASAVNVVETALCGESDTEPGASNALELQKRHQIASQLLRIIDKRHMIPPPRFLLMRDFLEFLCEFTPNVVIDRKHLEEVQQRCLEDYFQIASALAADANAQLNPKIVEIMQRAKLSTKLKLYQIASDPKSALVRLLEARRTTDNPWAPHDHTSIIDLRRQIAALGSQLRPAPGSVLQRLDKNRHALVEARAGDEVASAMLSVFEDNQLLHATFDIEALVHLGEKRHGAKGNRDDAARNVLVRLARFAGEHWLPRARIMQQAAWADLDTTLRKGKLKSKGTTLDCDHLACLPEIDVFVTGDRKLAASVRRSLKEIPAESRAFCVSKPRTLKAAIERGGGANARIP